jgi:hypothetical protein
MILTCKHPDRDCPKILCGYPLPCPWHTAVIDTTKDPPTVTIPVTAQAAWNSRHRLAEIAEEASDAHE